MKSCYIKLLAGMGLLASLGFSGKAEAFLAGAKGTGMAAAGVAYPQDAYAGATNPAGIVDVPDRIDVGVSWIQDRGHIKIRGNAGVAIPPPFASFSIPSSDGRYDSFKTKDVYDPDFGINKTFCTEICGNCWNWAVGLVLYNRDYQKTSYTKIIPLTGNTYAGLEYLHETISPLFALRINECHSVGVSLDIQVQRAKVNGLQNFALSSPPLPIQLASLVRSSSPNHVTNKGYAYSAGVGATIGWKWQVSDCLSFGVTYRTKATMSKFHKYKGFLAQHGKLDTPQKWLAGFAFKFLPCATIAFDVEWIDWHQIKALHNPLLRGNQQVPNLLGSENGPGFGFKDQTFYRVGIDYAVNDCLTVRAGFRHANSPIRRSQTAVNLLTCDCVENYVTVGASYCWNCAEISMYYAHGFSKHIKGKNSIPALFGGGNVDLTEAKDALGISIGYMF